jgi:biotin carboxylase
MNKSSLLVLAASKYQLETIDTAKRLGFRVVCTDNVPENPGHAVADQSYPIDTTDREGVLSLARRENVAGVVSPCTDVGVPTAAFVAERMGLVGPPLEAAEVVCDKLAFRQFLKSNGFRVPAFFALPARGKLSDSIFQDRFWIMKPDCSSGSKGVFIISSPEELQARLPEALVYSPNGRAILEEFVNGSQGTCEGILQSGRVAAACLLDRQTVAPPYVATCGHRVPTSLPVEIQRRVVSDLERLWRLLGVTDAIFDCDFVLSSDELYILEVSPRLGGNCISSLLLKASGFDITEFAIRLACNEHPRPPQSITLKPMAVMILGTSQPGRLSYDARAVESLRHTGWVDSLTMDVCLGSHVQPFINGRNRIGQCFIHGSSYEDIVAKTHEVLCRLQITANGFSGRVIL